MKKYIFALALLVSLPLSTSWAADHDVKSHTITVTLAGTALITLTDASVGITVTSLAANTWSVPAVNGGATTFSVLHNFSSDLKIDVASDISGSADPWNFMALKLVVPNMTGDVNSEAATSEAPDFANAIDLVTGGATPSGNAGENLFAAVPADHYVGETVEYYARWEPGAVEGAPEVVVTYTIKD